MAVTLAGKVFWTVLKTALQAFKAVSFLLKLVEIDVNAVSVLPTPHENAENHVCQILR